MPNQPNLADELIRQDGATPQGAAGAIVDRIALCERRRLRRWAIATAALWIITAGYILGLLWLHLVFIHPVLHEFLTNEDFRHRDLAPHAFALLTGLKALLLWPILLLLAAVCTTAFVLASRRATLHQIQASLKDISQQLQAISSTM